MRNLVTIPLSLNDTEAGIDNTFNLYEKITFILFAVVISTLTVIGGWSGVLLAIGKVDGGGPLGMIMEIIPLHSLI